MCTHVRDEMLIAEKRGQKNGAITRNICSAPRISTRRLDLRSFSRPRLRLFYRHPRRDPPLAQVRLSSTFRRTREIDRISNDVGNVNDIPRRKVEISPAEFDDPTPRL